MITIKRALVRPPSRSYSGCISSHPMHYLLDIELAKDQHSQYCKTLRELGLDLIQLPPDEKYPDSCFVEDTAIVFENRAVITRLAKESRRGEGDSISEILTEYKQVKHVTNPGTIEGGDIIHFPRYLLTGITERTNCEGVRQAMEWLGVTIEQLEAPDIVHLKSHVTYLGKDTVLVNHKFNDHPALKNYEKILVPKSEAYAANTLAVDDVVLMSSRHPTTLQLVRDAGFETIPLNMSEFEKCEGALTCLSILF